MAMPISTQNVSTDPTFNSLNNLMASVVKEMLASGMVRKPSYPSNLYQLLSLLPKDGLQSRVVPEKWKAYPEQKDSYYTITHVRLSPGMTQGLVCGIQTINGLVIFNISCPGTPESHEPAEIPEMKAQRPWRLWQE